MKGFVSMKSIGIVICNYNKCEHVLSCIQSVLESTTDDYSIYVVDNASTDASLFKIKNRFGNQVTLIENQQNLGSAGGFNTGIKRVLSAGHEFLMLLDNDAALDERALIRMRNYLLSHPDVGMVGAKILHKHDPGFVQQFGNAIDLKLYQVKYFYADLADNDSLPEVVECSTMSTTAVMLPTHVVKSVGLLPEEYFFGWDDFDWSYRIYNAGYKIHALGNARAIHEMAPYIPKDDTSTLYYQWRNAIYFFINYTPKAKWSNLTYMILNTMFQSIYECSYRGEKNMVSTIMRAYHDAIYARMGKIPESAVKPNDENHSQFTRFFQTSRSIYIEPGGEWLIPLLRMEHTTIHFSNNKEDADIIVRTCDNIFILKECASNIVYVDKQLNIISKPEDERIMDAYPFSLDLFLYMHQDEFLAHIEEITKEKDGDSEF